MRLPRVSTSPFVSVTPLKDSMEAIRACCPDAGVYYRDRMQLWINQGKKYPRQKSGKILSKDSAVFSQGMGERLLFRHQWMTIWLPLSPRCLEILMDSGMCYTCHLPEVTITTSLFSFFWVEHSPCDPEISLLGCRWPTPTDKQRHQPKRKKSDNKTSVPCPKSG